MEIWEKVVIFAALNQILIIMENTTDKTKKGNVMGTGKYLNPKADLTFYFVFGKNENLLMSLLNALLPQAESNPITEVEYLTRLMLPDKRGGEDRILAVRCKDTANRQFIVEMQMHWNEDFMKRVLPNVSKSVLKQAGIVDEYRQIQPVFSLHIIKDPRFQPDMTDFYHDYAVINVEHPEKTIDGLRFVFVELPKFQPKSIAEKKMAVLWLRFLTEIGEDTRVAPKELLENEQTRKALEIIEKSAMSDAQIMAYEDFMMSIEDEQVIREGFYKEGMTKGLADGMAKGLADGMAKGMAKGKAEGKAEANYENARKMKLKGFPVEDISEITGLTPKEIESL